MRRYQLFFVIVSILLFPNQLSFCQNNIFLNAESLDKIFTDKSFIAKSFSYPVGQNKAKGYYNALKFGKRSKDFGNNKHLGEDWNGVNGGDTDLGDPVNAIANGYVIFAGYGGPGWGNVIRIIHKLPDGKKYKYIESLYGHVINMKVGKGSYVKKGQQIAQIGNANGIYYAHLHIELRYKLNMPIGGGYGKNVDGFMSLTEFLKTYK